MPDEDRRRAAADLETAQGNNDRAVAECNQAAQSLAEVNKQVDEFLAKLTQRIN